MAPEANRRGPAFVRLARAHFTRPTTLRFTVLLTAAILNAGPGPAPSPTCFAAWARWRWCIAPTIMPALDRGPLVGAGPRFCPDRLHPRPSRPGRGGDLGRRRHRRRPPRPHGLRRGPSPRPDPLFACLHRLACGFGRVDTVSPSQSARNSPLPSPCSHESVPGRRPASVRPQRLIGLRGGGRDPKPDGEREEVLDALARFLEGEGFAVDRPRRGTRTRRPWWRASSRSAGRTLQWDGHSRHGPPAVRAAGSRGTGSPARGVRHEGGVGGGGRGPARAARRRSLRGLGPADRARPARAPWGDGRQFDQMIADGIVGDAVMLPEPLCDTCPRSAGARPAGRSRSAARPAGPRSHAPADEPSVIAAGAELVARLARLDEGSPPQSEPDGGRAERLRRADPRRRDLQPVPPRMRARRHPALAARDRPATRSNASSEIVDELAQRHGHDRRIEFHSSATPSSSTRMHPIVAAFRRAYARRATLAIGAETVRGRRQQRLGIEEVPAITHGPGRRPAHDRGMGGDRRPGAGGHRLCVDGRRFCPGEEPMHRATFPI